MSGNALADYQTYQGCCSTEGGIDENAFCDESGALPCMNGLSPTCTCFNDYDMDRWTTEGDENQRDCDDEEKTVYPGAFENCHDGMDNDCDGFPDWEDPEWDMDEDGWVSNECLPNRDCDDDDPDVNPDAWEDPENGVDDDCDGEIDEVEPMCFLTSLLM